MVERTGPRGPAAGKGREARLGRAFVALADTLVADFDLVDLLRTLVETCTELLDVEAAGLLLRGDGRELHLVASTTEDASFVEMVQLSAASGPCLECVERGEPVTVDNIDAEGGRWPEFREAALSRGFLSVHATPMRLRDQVIGAMNLFDSKAGALNGQDVVAAQALSDVATIGILSDRAARERDLVTAQLEYALDSRVVIEQAKGVLAHSASLDMDRAFTVLRSFARSHNMRLQTLAAALVERRLEVSRVVEWAQAQAQAQRPR